MELTPGRLKSFSAPRAAKKTVRGPVGRERTEPGGSWN
jgi:hypothetical protein